MKAELLKKVIDWYEKDSSVGGLSNLIDEIEAELAKPEQEPAWLAVEDGNETRFFNPDMIDYAKDFNRPITKLYTSPPQYEPLSDDEIGRLLPGRPAIDTFTGLFIVNQQFLIDFAHNIEKRITDGKS